MALAALGSHAANHIASALGDVEVVSDDDRLKELEKHLIDVDYERMAEDPVVRNDPLTDIVAFPDNDIEVVETPPTQRCADSAVPPMEEYVFMSLEGYVQDSIRSFDAPYKVLKFNNAQYGTGRPDFEPLPASAAPLQLYERDILDDKRMAEENPLAAAAAAASEKKKGSRSLAGIFDAPPPAGGDGGDGGDGGGADEGDNNGAEGDAESPGADGAGEDEGDGAAAAAQAKADPRGTGKAPATGRQGVQLSTAGSGGPADVEEIDENQTDPLLPSHVRNWDNSIIQENAGRRADGRVPLFKVFNDAAATASQAKTNIRKLDPPYPRYKPTFVQIDFKELLFELPEIEPFFVNVTLYDIGVTAKRISETFHLSLNSEYAVDMIKHVIDGEPHPYNLARKVMFELERPSQSVWLVFRFEKVLQGDVESVCDPYMKFSSLKPKEHQKITEQARAACERTGAFRQPFVWAAMPLFNEENSLMSYDEEAGAATNERVIDTFYRQVKDHDEEHLFEVVSEVQTSSKKHKCIHGRFVFDVKAVDADEVVSGRVSTSMVETLPVVAGDAAAGTVSPYIREMTLFPLVPCFLPHREYVNNLFVYPEFVDLSSKKGSAKSRNICIRVKLMSSDDDAHAEGLAAIEGLPEWPLWVNSASTVTQYHNKTPTFYDQIKVNLPTKLTPLHHLLFSFVSVEVKPSKKSTELETPLGYACLPLYAESRIIEDEVHLLPVADELPPSYVLGDAQDKTKYLDNGRGLFRVRTSLVSSIFTQDAALNSFFHQFGSRDASATMLRRSIQLLANAAVDKIIRHAPTLLNSLIKCVVHYDEDVSVPAFRKLVFMMHLIYEEADPVDGPRNSILSSFVNYSFSSAEVETKHHTVKKGATVYATLLHHWVDILDQADLAPFDRALNFSWVLFDLIIKSMTEQLDSSEEMKTVPIKERYGSEFLHDLRCLYILMRNHVHTLSKTGLVFANSVNENLALFSRNLFTLMDRGFVYELVQRYVRQFLPSSSETLVAIKFDFLRVVCDYEHYVPLNLVADWDPVERYDITRPTTLVKAFWRAHMLAGLLLNEVVSSLSHPEKNCRTLGIHVLRNLLFKHEYDSRYEDGERVARVATMYFPLIKMVGELTLAMTRFDLSERRDILICVLWVLKNVPATILKGWWSGETLDNTADFFGVLTMCVETFEYVGKAALLDRKMADLAVSDARARKAQIEGLYAGSSHKRRGTLRSSMRASKTASIQGTGTGVRGSRSFKAHTLKKSELANASVVAELDGDDHRLETVVSTESALIVLDTIELYIETFKDELMALDGQNARMQGIVGLFTTLLDTSQSERFVKELFASIRAFVHRFAPAVFNASSTYCGEFCSRILRLCNSSLESVRSEASAALYLMMRINYDSVKKPKDFAMMKLQTTIALSKLAGSAFEQNVRSDLYLRLSLNTIAAYAKEESGSADRQRFATEVEELMQRLYDILRDSLKLLRYSYDPEMQADLLFRIADGYVNAPSLRLEWLLSLKRFHEEQGNTAETAMCQVHVAALVAEFLYRIEYIPCYPRGSTDFVSVSTNVKEESSIAASVKESEGVCQSDPFTPQGLITLLIESVTALTNANLWEYANEIYKLLIPIYEKNREYTALSAAHGHLSELFTKVATSNASMNRYLATYYRVGFYGQQFEDLDGVEFIYKEPTITRLSEISDRVKAMFRSEFGEEDFVLIQDSNDVKKEDLDPNKCYVQITSLEPYFEPHELADRPAYFEQNTNLTRFIFETPFTMSGKARGDVHEQYKRKTVLTVEKPFPYIVKRIRVVKREEKVLTPIENAIEEIEKRVPIIACELKGEDSNPKRLQMVLQGSVRLQVNAGPMAICESFLGHADDFPAKDIARLRAAFTDFLQVCGQALRVNKALIEADQYLYQKDLETGYRETCEMIEPYLHGELRGILSDDEGGDSDDDDDDDSSSTASDFQELDDITSMLE